MKECILIKNDDLEEIKKNHPNKQLLEKIKKLEEKVEEKTSKLNLAQLELSKLKENPEVRIDPMEMKIVLLEKRVNGQHAEYYNYDSYLSIGSVNFTLHENLREQLLKTKKLVTDTILLRVHRQILDDEQYIIGKERSYIANLGYLARRKLLKKYKK